MNAAPVPVAVFFISLFFQEMASFYEVCVKKLCNLENDDVMFSILLRLIFNTST